MPWTRPRNAFSLRAGDTMRGSVPTIAALQAQFSEVGGPLTPRYRRYLRRFCLPFASDPMPGPATIQLVFIIPNEQYIQNAPPAVLALVDGATVDASASFYAANPWINNESNAVDPALLDALLGPELTEEESPESWDEPPP